MGRTIGQIAQWNEMVADPEQKAGHLGNELRIPVSLV